nr:hypothetical protein [Helicobacter pylori]
MTNKNAVYFETIPLSAAKVLSVIVVTHAVLRAFISNFYKKSGIFQFFLIILDKR